MKTYSKSLLSVSCLFLLLTGCSYLNGNQFPKKEKSSVSVIRTETDKRDIQIDYVSNQATEVKKLISALKWLDVTSKDKVLSDINFATSQLPGVSSAYHKVCSSNNQSYYESFNYFIDQYLGSVMRIEDAATIAMNQTQTNTKLIFKQSKCSDVKGCNSALTANFMTIYNTKSAQPIKELQDNLKLIGSLETYQNTQ